MSPPLLRFAPPDRLTLLHRLRLVMWGAFIISAVGLFGFALPLGFDPDTLTTDGQSWFAQLLLVTHFAMPVGCGGLIYGAIGLWRLGAMRFQLRTLLFAMTVFALLLGLSLGNVQGVDEILNWPPILTWLFVPVATSGYLAASVYVNLPRRGT